MNKLNSRKTSTQEMFFKNNGWNHFDLSLPNNSFVISKSRFSTSPSWYPPFQTNLQIVILIYMMKPTHWLLKVELLHDDSLCIKLINGLILILSFYLFSCILYLIKNIDISARPHYLFPFFSIEITFIYCHLKFCVVSFISQNVLLHRS